MFHGLDNRVSLKKICNNKVNNSRYSDGSSEHDVQVWREIGVWTPSRHLTSSTVVVKSDFFLERTTLSLHICALCPELPSNFSTNTRGFRLTKRYIIPACS